MHTAVTLDDVFTFNPMEYFCLFDEETLLLIVLTQ